MNRFKSFLVALVVFSFVSYTPKAHAIPPKAKAFLVVSAYGTVGGALLGFATLAYGANSRAIAQGASLGLYAGIIFGSYILATHKSPDERMQEYEQQYSNPQGPPPEDTGGWGAPAPEQEAPSGGGFFDFPQRGFEIQQNYNNNFKMRGAKLTSPPLYFNLLQLNF